MYKTLIIVDLTSEHLPTSNVKLGKYYEFYNRKYLDALFRKKILPVIRQRSGSIVFAMDPEAEKQLAAAGIQFKIPEDFVGRDFYKKVETNARDFIRDIPKMDAFFQLTASFEGVNLWEVAQIDSLNYFKPMAEAIDLVESIVNKTKVEKICIFDRHSKVGKAIAAYSAHKNISLEDHTLRRHEIFSGIRKMAFPIILNLIKPYALGKLKLKPREMPLTHGKKMMLIESSLMMKGMIPPWAEKLKDEYSIIFAYIGDLKAKVPDYVQARNITEYATKDLMSSVKSYERKCKSYFNNISRLSYLQSKIRYKGIAAYDLLKELLAFYLLRDFPELAKQEGLARRSFQHEKPVLNVSFDELGRRGRLVTAAAKMLGIKTIMIQHGFIADYPMFGKFNSDRFCVYGDETRKTFIDIGVDKKKIVVTGNVRFDALAERNKSEDGKAVIEQLKIDHSRKIVTFASQPVSREENETLLRALFSAFKDIPDAQLIIKTHPSENESFHKNLAREMGSDAIVVKQFDTAQLINASDLLITYWSTVGYDAIALDKPMMILNLSGKPDKVNYVKNKAAIGVYKEQDIIPSVKKILHDGKTQSLLKKNRSRYLRYSLYKIDGKASERVVKEIKNLIS